MNFRGYFNILNPALNRKYKQNCTTYRGTIEGSYVDDARRLTEWVSMGRYVWIGQYIEHLLIYKMV